MRTITSLRIGRRKYFVLAGAALLLITGTTFAVIAQNQKSTADSTQNSAKQTADAKQSATNTTTTAPNTATNGPSKPSAATGVKTTDPGSSAIPDTTACKLLTLTVAQHIIGSGGAYTASGDTSAYEATDIELTACAYSSGPQTIQLIARIPTSSVGESENAIAFGSGKPSGVTKVSGYGQAAYWDADPGQLNVLKDNKWYIISRTTDGKSATQSTVETIADQLIQEF